MSSHRTLTRPGMGQSLLRTGLCIGLAGGAAEIAVVWLYSALTGGDAAMIARQVGYAVGLPGASAATGVAIHMALAAPLGVALIAALQTVAGRSAHNWIVFPFMLASLAIVWTFNFFVLLPVLSPDFVHLLPYAVSLTSKLSFGLLAAVTLRALPRAAWLRPTPGAGYAGAPVHASAHPR